jgi:hypothetical protein
MAKAMSMRARTNRAKFFCRKSGVVATLAPPFGRLIRLFACLAPVNILKIQAARLGFGPRHKRKSHA